MGSVNACTCVDTCTCVDACTCMLGKGLEAMRPFGGMSEFEMKVDIRSLDCVCAACMYVLEGTYVKRWGCGAARL